MGTKMSNEEFKKIIKEKFNNEITPLDKYISYRKSNRMRFKCNRNPLHNEIYFVSSQQILRTDGKGCPFCDNKGFTESMITEKLKDKYGEKIKLKDKWIYGETDVFTKLTFVCKKHGEFSSNYNLISKESCTTGCKKCGTENAVDNKLTKARSTIEERISKKTKGKITILKETYFNPTTKATFICKKHGKFKAFPGHFLYEGRIKCPSCSMSNGELLIYNFLKKKYKKVKKEYSFKNLALKKKLRFDFYLPNENILIEFDGKQHFDSKSIFYSENLLESDKLKNNFAKKHKICLIRIAFHSNSLNNKKQIEIKKKLKKAIKEESSTTIEIY